MYKNVILGLSTWLFLFVFGIAIGWGLGKGFKASGWQPVAVMINAGPVQQ